MTLLPPQLPQQQPQIDNELNKFMSPENRNSLMSSPNPQETLKGMLTSIQKKFSMEV